jgi:hypothetical protein
MNNELVKNLEGSVRGLIEVTYQQLSGMTEKNLNQSRLYDLVKEDFPLTKTRGWNQRPAESETAM